MHHVAKRILSSGYAVMHVYLEELRGLSLPTRTGWNEATRARDRSGGGRVTAGAEDNCVCKLNFRGAKSNLAPFPLRLRSAFSVLEAEVRAKLLFPSLKRRVRSVSLVRPLFRSLFPPCFISSVVLSSMVHSVRDCAFLMAK